MNISEFKNRFLPQQRLMYWAAWRATGNKQEAEDIVQEAFLRLWTHRDTLPPILNDAAYCITLVRHISVDRHRILHPQVINLEEADANLVATEEDILERINRSQLTERIKDIICQLPTQQRQIITLIDIEDRDYTEVSQLTGLTEGNVRVILSRARKTIREKFRK